MKRLLLVLSCALCLAVVAPVASASTDLRFWHRKHKDKDAAKSANSKDAAKSKDASESAAAPKPKAKRTFLHRAKAKPSREQAARSEATYGMTGPKSVGWRHPHPGPAGVGAK
jgi:hypothetical protein